MSQPFLKAQRGSGEYQRHFFLSVKTNVLKLCLQYYWTAPLLLNAWGNKTILKNIPKMSVTENLSLFVFGRITILLIQTHNGLVTFPLESW